jgi:methionyl aminopeptidase
MIIIKSPREINLMKESGRILGEIWDFLRGFLQPGVSTLDVSHEVERIMKEHGAISAEKGYEGYPEAACVSINEQLVHGIPSAKRILRDGDIVSVDLVVLKNGFMADACRTYPVGIYGERQKKIIEVTEQCFWNGVSLIKPGIHLGDVQEAIQRTAESQGYSVCREYTGHGIGTHMHEDPYIPNYGTKGTGPILREGMTLCFEPMLLEGKAGLRIMKDGWTAVSKDGKLTCHYENTVVVTKDGYEILTLSPSEIEERRKTI